MPLHRLLTRPRPGTGRSLTGLVVAAALVGGGLTARPAAAAPSTPPSAAVTAAPATTPTLVATKGETETSEVALASPTGRSDGAATTDADVAVTGWTTTVALTPGTQMVALTWEAAGSGPGGPGSATVSVRPLTGGVPGEWLSRTGEGAGEEGDGREGSDLIWLGDDADGVEVRVDAGPLVDLRLLRMRYEEGVPTVVASEPSVEARTSTGTVAAPTIRPRSEWGTGTWQSTTSGCSAGPQVADRLDHVIVHHTAGVNGYTVAQVPGIINGIYQYHTAGLRWCDIAYNLLIDAFGTVWQGRSGPIGEPVIGGHAAGFNTRSMGLSLLGQFEPGATPTAAQPTTAMMDAAARTLAWLMSRHGLDPTGTVRVTSLGNPRFPAGTTTTIPVINAHRDSAYTACPGANVVSRLPALRTTVAGLMSSVTPPPTTGAWSPFATVEDLVWRQYVDILGQPGTYASRLWWQQALVAGSTNRNALVASLIDSTAGQNRTASTVRLYLAYFGRVPDSAGIRYWWAQRDAGASVRRVSQAFTFSPEFTSRYGRLSNADFVRLVYRNVLGRSAEAAGLSYWTRQLDQGRENRGGVMAQFSESAENTATREAEVDVIVVHEAMLGRAISSADLTTWAAQVRSRTIGSLIGTIFASSEYARRVG